MTAHTEPIPELWPPLALIRSAFERDAAAAPADGVPVRAPGQAAAEHAAQASQQEGGDLLLPLIELARRREAVARHAFSARWAPGRLVSVVHEGRLLGVLLDRCVQAEVWHGWMAASEADWAGAFDVLLEPGDEPFEPSFGLVQAWNVVTLRNTPQLCARVLGEISATRLAAIRAVADESTAQTPLAIEPEPGRIALRTVGGVFSVLSGTPLGAVDPRSEYQSLYREAALRLGAAVRTAPPPVARSQQAVAPPVQGGWGARVRRWLGGDGVLRPAFAVLALVVVLQNVGPLWTSGGDEEVRFRSAPTQPAATVPADLVVRWKDGASMAATQTLLRSVSAEVVGGPDAQGHWRLRLPDARAGRATLAASPWVESVAVP
jgi:hypothetical protein